MCAVMVLLGLCGNAAAENVIMPQFGHQTVTVSAGNPVTFMDMKSHAGISSSSSNNSFATTIFQPAEAGNAIRITFQNLDVRNDGASWPAYVKVYDGVFDVTSVTYPTTTSGVNATEFPSTAQQLDRLDGTYSNLVYVSSDATGALSVCYHYKYAKAINGWTATVESVTLEQMTVTGAAGDNTMVDAEVWSGKTDVAVAGLTVTTEGYSAPDALQLITFTCSGNTVLNPEALVLYAGSAASTATLTALPGVITENAGEYTYTLTTPYMLGNGTNTFCLGGNILATAAFNTTATVNVTGVTMIGGFSTFTPATATTLTVQPMYLMATDATYTVSQPTQFYDEGGKDGNVIKGFNGKVVFTPATAGKKVQLTFKDIEVFYTDYAASNTGYVDYIKVYSGNSTNAQDLLWEINAAQASLKTDLVIKSTAADGKLTVTHTCNVSYDSNLKAGWTAVVDEFTPQAMTLSELTYTKPSGTAVAGMHNALLGAFTLTTANTEPALVPASLTLTTDNTFAQMSAMKLYYTKDNTFATSHLLGEATVSGNTVSITVTNPTALREGENHLWLTADVVALAENGQRLDFTPTSLTFTNSTDYTTFAAVTGGLTIENKAVQACGEQTFTIQGEWLYTHTVTSEYSSKYMYENCDQTVIFKPAHAGNVIQIDYTDFDVYYATSSYGTKAKYIVYAGEGTGGATLWELDANGKQPTQIRSNAADGALTIVFNPNTTSSYYTGNGWHATVKEYQLQNMAPDTVIVAQTGAGLVKPGATNAALLDLNVKTTGSMNPIALSAVTVNLKGSEANVSKVYLLQGETVLAEANAAANVVLTLTTPVTLEEYDNHFTVAVDVKSDATVDATIDAAVTAVTVGGNAVAVTQGDPEGSSVIKNVMLIAAGNNGTITIGQNSLMLYDDGGADGQYSSGFEGYVTFTPANAGYAVELVMKQFDIAYLSGDPFRIYYSNAYDAEATADKTFGMYNMPADNESVISAAADGSLTLYVKMPSSRKSGFEVEVRQHLLTDLAIDSVVVSTLAPAEATKGSSDIRMMQAAVYVSGDRTPITITNFDQTASALLTERHIYATEHNTTFSTTNEVTGTYAIAERGVYYFWFVGSIDTQAQVGNTLTWQLNNVVWGTQQTAPAQTAAATIQVVSGAHGYYLIGAGNTADYPTLTAALNAIRSIGMDGPVTLAVESGLYTEQVTVPEISGAGAANTLTIRSVTGDYNDVTYQYNGASLSSTQGVFTIAGADYITLKGLSFTSTQTSNQTPTVMVVNNASTHVTIDSCHIYAARYTEYTARLDLLRVDAGQNLYNNDFALTNSVLDGGYMGMNVTGHKAAADPLQQNMLIRGNRFANQGKQQLYGDAVSNLQIIGNTFRAEAKSSSANAIDWLLIGDTAIIADNDILYTAAASDNQSIKAIYLRPNSYQDKENAVWCIVNNVVNVQNASSYASYCINFSTNMCKLLVAHNTMVLQSEGTASSPFYIEAAPTAGSRFVNNIFQSTVHGYAVRYKNAAAINDNIAYEHNILYTPDNTFGMPTATVSTFADWKTAVSATDAQGNLNEAAVFASANLLLPAQDNEGRLLTAAVLDFVTTDITGKTRAATPTIGAYEYDPNMMRVPVLAAGYPMAQNVRDSLVDIVLKTDNLGTANVLVLPATADAPTVAEVLAQGAELTLAKDAETSLTVKNLNEETSYKAYVVTLSPMGNTAEAVAATDVFTTAWTLRPVVLNPIEAVTVNENDTFSLVAAVATEYPQAKPYTYKWYTTFSTTEIAATDTLTRTADQTTEYICCVTDKYGQKALVSAHVSVTKSHAAATFEEYNLAAGGHKMVEEVWADNTETWFYSGTYAFANTPNKAYNAFSGFVISADDDSTYVGNYMVDQFRSAAGGAYEGQNFAVAYYSAPSSWFAGYTCPIMLTNSTTPQTLTGCYITNSTYTLDAILNGDYANPAFTQGDYMSLTVKGYNGEQSTGQIVFYLADYRSTNAEEHFALTKWKWLDLSNLGAVTRIEFDMYTTKSDQYGFTTPTYFCIDNFGGVAPGEGTGLLQPSNASNALTPVKRIENGMLIIITPDGKRYTATGQRME